MIFGKDRPLPIRPPAIHSLTIIESIECLHRKELVDLTITEHRGRIVKTTRDGMLVEFVSVVDAVRCAVDFSAVWASRRSPLVSLRAPDYPYFTSREETVAAVEEAAADWGGPVYTLDGRGIFTLRRAPFKTRWQSAPSPRS
jgi:hypothetical protein